MRLCYQVATPEVTPAPGVTAYQGDLEHAFARLRECGYEGAELMVCDPRKINVEELKRLSEQYGLEIPMVCTGEVFGQGGVCFSHPDPENRQEAIDRCKAAVDVAKVFGAQVNIGRVRGGMIWGEDPAACRTRSIEGMREVAEYAKERGVIVALEPVNSIAINFINTTQEGIAAVKEVGVSSFKLMLDSNHMYIEDMDMEQSVIDAKDYVTYVHLVDSNRLYPGNRKLDFNMFLHSLREIGYNGWVSVEVFQRPTQDIALEKSAEYIRGVLNSI